MILAIILILFIVFMLLKTPVSISIGSAVLFTLALSNYSSFTYIVPLKIVEGASNPVLLAIPFFILTGNLMNATNMTDRIFNFADALVGHWRAGLAQVNIVASMVFAGISGAALADAAGLGRIEIKAMRDRGYSPEFSGAITLASSVIGPLIPPSLGLIIYSFLSSTSVARLFLAGVVPGILVGGALMIYCAFFAKTGDFVQERKTREWRRVKDTAFDGIAALLAPLFILGSITSGLVTPTEAGIIACFYALGLGVFYRSLTWRALWLALSQTVLITAVIMMIIGFSNAMGWLITIERTPQLLAEFIVGNISNPYIFLAILVVFLLVIGAFIEGNAATLILVPVLLPAVDSLGIDRIHFGLVMTFGMLIGIATPPMGIGLYVVAEVGGIKLEKLAVAMLPFVLVLIAVLLVMTFIPATVLTLPNLILGPS